MLKKIVLTTIAISVTLSSMTVSTSVLAGGEAKTNQFWWPEQLNLMPLRQHGLESNPYGEKFNYAEEFASLDINKLKKDIQQTLTDSKAWWPADWGHYGPLMIRMAWHSAGVYRVHDGRGGASGGQQRFDPLNSWPDNVNLDKARRLLWPIKQKYGRKISWADLMVLSGNVALESMGFKTFGFAGGRTDDWEPDLVYWGSETAMLTDKRRDKKGKLKGPLAAVEMGLIYVNPVGPHGIPDPLLAANDIRMSFGRMAMNDEEIVALIAGGHTLGKAHGAKKPDKCIGAEPGAAKIEEQGFGWKNKCASGVGADTTSSGLEGAWTVTPTKWSSNFLDNLMNFNWVQTKSPAGAIQWIPDNKAAANLVPDAHIPNKRHAPIMFTTDLALKEDPSFRKIVERFRKNPKEFDKAFGKAWFKLTHRDMGPRARYVGTEVPSEVLTWQDPIPVVDHKLITSKDIAILKKQILKSGLTTSELVRTAWASASSHRVTDMRGGANGARIRLEPQKSWEVNSPKELNKVLAKLESLQRKYNKTSSKTKVSLADLIVLGGATAIESASKQAGYDVVVAFRPGRMDSSQAQTDVKSFNYLKPTADGFRNYYSQESYMSPTEMLIDKGNLLGLNVPEMTVLVGGMRVLNANYNGSNLGVFTDNPGELSNDFFVNLLDMSTVWTKAKSKEGIYEGHDRASGKLKWQATPVDLIFGSSSELRAIAEVYASDDAKDKFVEDFIKAWVKVMQLDRFDLTKI
ncbi:MAG: catalase/peroxidase HPI [Gammaproteobacteria bacterium]|nr:MAG: catalase/peroxidase HPI [Gammaproteobacteria bacterium]